MPGRKQRYIIEIHSWLRAVIICCLALFIGGCAFVTGSTWQYRAFVRYEQRPPALPSTVSHEPIDEPARLLITKVQIDATVELVSILPDGELGVPEQEPFNNVGWYEHGPKPGERGSAVIDGHLNQPGGEDAVFAALDQLVEGDQVVVITKVGRTLRFNVDRVELYPPDQAPLQNIFGNHGGYYLNLITCAGDWIESEGQTSLRLVVYTSLAP